MNSTAQTLSNIYPEHFWIRFSDSDLDLASSIIHNYSNETGKNHACFNQLCLNAIGRWLQEYLGLKTAPSLFHDAIVWEFVNGCGIQVNNKRLVFITSDAIDIEDFGVPKEWVDIPSLAADYYLPVQVDLEQQYLHVWGFISRKSLKFKADYDPIYRLYYVNGDDVIGNLDLLRVLCSNESCLDAKVEVDTLPRISEQEAKDLIDKLSPYSPRLKVKFEKWGALLNDSCWLLKLYQQRTQPLPVLMNLSMWLDGIVEAGWQTFDQFFSNQILAPAFRGKQVRGINLETPKMVKRAVRQLRNSQNQVDFPDDINDIDALVHLLHNTPDETIRWKAADYLWKIAPDHPKSPIRRMMDVGVQLIGNSIALMVGVMRKIDGKIAVLLRVYPIKQEPKLPPGLQLVILDENGELIPGLSAIARSNPLDDYMNLYFSADVGDRFSVQLSLEHTSITEQFVV
jgi:Protein of unknown function (DUF1822)